MLWLSIIMIVLNIFTVSAYAVSKDNFAAKGLYLTGQAGIGKTESGFLDDLVIVSTTRIYNNPAFAGRIGLGYQLNRFLAIESGFSVGVAKLSKVTALFEK